jgi:hypothetical protein
MKKERSTERQMGCEDYGAFDGQRKLLEALLLVPQTRSPPASPVKTAVHPTIALRTFRSTTGAFS